MGNVNENLFDAANRHQTFLIRYGGSAANDAVKLLKEAEKDLVARIAQRVDKLGPTAKGNLQSFRLQAILADIRQQTRDLTNALHTSTRKELLALAKQETDIASKRLIEAVGADLGNFRVSPETLRTLVDKRSVGGKSLRRWFTRLGADRVGRLEAAINMGVIQGENLGQITRRFREAEGVTQRTAKTMVRTQVNHVANQSREALYEANSDIVEQLRWTSTLDGRTSAICQARDGKTYNISEGPRPPAHPNCRSIMTPVLKSWESLAKPGALKPGRGAADIDTLFQKNLKKQGFEADEIFLIKRNTRASMNGQVPNDLTYQDWLKRQPVGFQDEVLGKTRGQLFRDGGLSLDRFVEPTTGQSLNLDAIRKKNEKAWMQAGVGQTEKPLEYWDKTTLIGGFHEEAFLEAPTYIKHKISKTEVGFIPNDGTNDAYYSPLKKSIHMGLKTTEDDRQWAATWSHEMGHALDDSLSPVANAYWSSGLKGTMLNEGLALEQNASKIGSRYVGGSLTESYLGKLTKNAALNEAKFNELNLEVIEKFTASGKYLSGAERIVIQRKWAEDKLAKHGLKLADVEDVLALDDGFDGWEKTPNVMIHFIVGLEREDITYILSNVIKASDVYRGKSIFVADYFGGLSENRVGWGHSNDYYKTSSKLGPTEAFANAVTLLNDKNPTWGIVLEKFTPATMKAIIRKLKDV